MWQNGVKGGHENLQSVPRRCSDLEQVEKEYHSNWLLANMH